MLVPWLCSHRKSASGLLCKLERPTIYVFSRSIVALISAQKIDCGEAVLTSTHNLCFEQKHYFSYSAQGAVLTGTHILCFEKHRLWVLVRVRDGTNEYPQSIFFSKHRLLVLDRTASPYVLKKNIDCWYSLEFVFSRNKNNNVYTFKPQFYYMKVGFKGVKII